VNDAALDHREGAFISRHKVEEYAFKGSKFEFAPVRFQLKHCVREFEDSFVKGALLQDKSDRRALSYLAILTCEKYVVFIRANEMIFLRHVVGPEIVLWSQLGVHVFDTLDFPVYRTYLAVPTSADLVKFLVEEDAP